MENLINSKIFIMFVIYGVIVGALTIAIWPKDLALPFLLNAPGI